MITIPTLSELYTGILNDLETQFGISISTTGKTFLRALAAVQAAKLKLYYLVIGNLQKNIWPDTADPESLGGTLERFGRVKLGRNPFPATAGEYILTVTGTSGAVIPASTTFKSDDTSLNPGFLFILDNAYTLSSSSGTITVRALTTGVDSKLAVFDTLTSTSPIALVNSSVYVSAIDTEPTAAETTEAYRTAILNSFRLETQGGAATDYRIWSADAAGVAKVYPFAKNGEQGSVSLFVEATIADSTDGKGTPSQQILDDVEEVVDFNPDTTLALNERGRRPVNALVYYLPVSPKDVDITITGFDDLTTDIQAEILSALTDAISGIRPFVAAADVLEDKNDILDTNKIIATILAAHPGAIFDSVTLEVDGAPLSTYTFIDGNIPFLNSVTYA